MFFLKDMLPFLSVCVSLLGHCLSSSLCHTLSLSKVKTTRGSEAIIG